MGGNLAQSPPVTVGVCPGLEQPTLHLGVPDPCPFGQHVGWMAGTNHQGPWATQGGEGAGE